MRCPAHEDFILEIITDGQQYQTRSRSRLIGETPFQPLPAAAVKTFAIYGQKLSEERTRRYLASSEAAVLGANLFAALFSGPNRQAWDGALARVRATSGRLRLLIQYAQEPMLHETPWELLFDGEEFLAIGLDTTLARYLLQARGLKTLSTPSPVRVLFTGACPPTQAQLDLESEKGHVRRGLGSSRAGSALFAEQMKVSHELLRRNLIRAETCEKPYHIWHHCGHGGLDADAFVLALEAEDGSERLVPAAHLAGLLAECAQLRMVFLNVCHGGTSAGLATSLAELNVPAVIGHRTAVHDQTALRFSRVLYENLLEQPLDWAVRQARLALRTGSRDMDWVLPLLFLRTTEAVFLPNR